MDKKFDKKKTVHSIFLTYEANESAGRSVVDERAMRGIKGSAIRDRAALSSHKERAGCLQ